MISFFTTYCNDYSFLTFTDVRMVELFDIYGSQPIKPYKSLLDNYSYSYGNGQWFFTVYGNYDYNYNTGNRWFYIRYREILVYPYSYILDRFGSLVVDCDSLFMKKWFVCNFPARAYIYVTWWMPRTIHPNFHFKLFPLNYDIIDQTFFFICYISNGVLFVLKKLILFLHPVLFFKIFCGYLFDLIFWVWSDFEIYYRLFLQFIIQIYTWCFSEGFTIFKLFCFFIALFIFIFPICWFCYILFIFFSKEFIIISFGGSIFFLFSLLEALLFFSFSRYRRIFKGKVKLFFYYFYHTLHYQAEIYSFSYKYLDYKHPDLLKEEKIISSMYWSLRRNFYYIIIVIRFFYHKIFYLLCRNGVMALLSPYLFIFYYIVFKIRSKFTFWFYQIVWYFTARIRTACFEMAVWNLNYRVIINLNLVKQWEADYILTEDSFRANYYRMLYLDRPPIFSMFLGEFFIRFMAFFRPLTKNFDVVLYKQPIQNWDFFKIFVYFILIILKETLLLCISLLLKLYNFGYSFFYVFYRLKLSLMRFFFKIHFYSSLALLLKFLKAMFFFPFFCLNFIFQIFVNSTLLFFKFFYILQVFFIFVCFSIYHSMFFFIKKSLALIKKYKHYIFLFLLIYFFGFWKIIGFLLWVFVSVFSYWVDLLPFDLQNWQIEIGQNFRDSRILCEGWIGDYLKRSAFHMQNFNLLKIVFWPRFNFLEKFVNLRQFLKPYYFSHYYSFYASIHPNFYFYKDNALMFFYVGVNFLLFYWPWVWMCFVYYQIIEPYIFPFLPEIFFFVFSKIPYFLYFLQVNFFSFLCWVLNLIIVLLKNSFLFIKLFRNFGFFSDLEFLCRESILSKYYYWYFYYCLVDFLNSYENIFILSKALFFEIMFNLYFWQVFFYELFGKFLPYIMVWFENSLGKFDIIWSLINFFSLNLKLDFSSYLGASYLWHIKLSMLDWLQIFSKFKYNNLVDYQTSIPIWRWAAEGYPKSYLYADAGNITLLDFFVQSHKSGYHGHSFLTHVFDYGKSKPSYQQLEHYDHLRYNYVPQRWKAVMHRLIGRWVPVYFSKIHRHFFYPGDLIPDTFWSARPQPIFYQSGTRERKFLFDTVGLDTSVGFLFDSYLTNFAHWPALFGLGIPAFCSLPFLFSFYVYFFSTFWREFIFNSLGILVDSEFGWANLRDKKIDEILRKAVNFSYKPSNDNLQKVVDKNQYVTRRFICGKGLDYFGWPKDIFYINRHLVPLFTYNKFIFPKIMFDLGSDGNIKTDNVHLFNSLLASDSCLSLEDRMHLRKFQSYWNLHVDYLFPETLFLGYEDDVFEDYLYPLERQNKVWDSGWSKIFHKYLGDEMFVYFCHWNKYYSKVDYLPFYYDPFLTKMFFYNLIRIDVKKVETFLHFNLIEHYNDNINFSKEYFEKINFASDFEIEGDFLLFPNANYRFLSLKERSEENWKHFYNLDKNFGLDLPIWSYSKVFNWAQVLPLDAYDDACLRNVPPIFDDFGKEMYWKPFDVSTVMNDSLKGGSANPIVQRAFEKTVRDSLSPSIFEGIKHYAFESVPTDIFHYWMLSSFMTIWFAIYFGHEGILAEFYLKPVDWFQFRAIFTMLFSQLDFGQYLAEAYNYNSINWCDSELEFNSPDFSRRYHQIGYFADYVNYGTSLQGNQDIFALNFWFDFYWKIYCKNAYFLFKSGFSSFILMYKFIFLFYYIFIIFSCYKIFIFVKEAGKFTSSKKPRWLSYRDLKSVDLYYKVKQNLRLSLLWFWR